MLKSFYILIFHLYILLGEIALLIFPHFLIGLFVFLMLNFESSFYILDESFVRYVICKHFFFPVRCLLFIIFTRSFTEWKSYIWWSPCYIFLINIKLCVLFFYAVWAFVCVYVCVGCFWWLFFFYWVMFMRLYIFAYPVEGAFFWR